MQTIKSTPDNFLRARNRLVFFTLLHMARKLKQKGLTQSMRKNFLLFCDDCLEVGFNTGVNFGLESLANCIREDYKPCQN